MKKSLIALAVLAASGAAMAQSTVTVYGLVDASFGSFKTNVAGVTPGTFQSQTQTRINTDGLNGNRWGLRVSEDLGGGMSAIANLESGFAIDSGASAQGGLLFGRRAYVGLASTSFGSVTLGRNGSPYNDVAYDHSTLGASIFDPANLNNGTTAPTAGKLLARNTTWIGFGERIDNSVKYVSPNFSGFTFGALYGFGENKDATFTGQAASKTVSVSAKYVNGPMLVSAGYQSEGIATTATTKPALENTLVNAAYDFGVAKVAAGFNRAKYKDIGIIAGKTDTAPQNEWNLSVAVPVGAATLSASYAVSKGDDLGKSAGFGVQALYSLSKRTTLYAGALSTKAYDKLAAAQAAGSTIERTQTYAVGVRHTF
jgi:predicted porin